MKIEPPLHLTSSIDKALQNGQPVVAFESTIIFTDTEFHKKLLF